VTALTTRLEQTESLVEEAIAARQQVGSRQALLDRTCSEAAGRHDLA